ncbi:5'/3'-nucleotidase SurE [Sulfobacillus thermosulfidooxidans]|uniref:5'/3'-nucleotidase SurE n=1 Tax=Sulfobacillus thermosulfidooxidans TaxID=28034 RepID=UPI0006B5A6EB|nr:5'/3'-nucleotidase SurE [Sulfobacillus thermosulfidooxidans]
MQQARSVFLTNDDSIPSPGLEVLMTVLTGLGFAVTVGIPATNQSGKSHSITLGTLSVTPTRFPQNIPAYVVHGTPVDCVRLALAEYWGPRPAWIVSGINRGWNVGQHVLTSGTVAAAREAAWYGVPALALSMADGPVQDGIVSVLVRDLPAWMTGAAQIPGYYLNINLPSSPARDWHWADWDPTPGPLAVDTIPGTDVLRLRMAEPPLIVEKPGAELTDVAWIQRGHIAVSALAARPPAFYPNAAQVPPGRQAARFCDAQTIFVHEKE